MTAEVAIMNQHALVLAADSATTVTRFEGGQREVRYFKGANKLFQLSAAHPVGLMIYGSASMHDVPWELIVKDFRANLGTKPLSRLSDYATRFFSFVKEHVKLFPEDARAQTFRRSALIAAYWSHLDAVNKEAAPASGDAPVAYTASLEAERTALQAQAPEAPVTAADIEGALAAHAGEVAANISKDTDFGTLPAETLALLAEIGIRRLMASYKMSLSETGIVIGGYGEDDYYPCLESFDCYGFLDRVFVCNPRSKPQCIGRDLPAVLEAFATTSMINTFRMGIGPEVFGHITKATKSELRAFAGKVKEALGAQQEIPNLDGLIDDAVTNHQGQWFRQSLAENFGPLANVIGSLPVFDMAALAKSLIELQSLKERVTKPSESVGGPIDVAVISKHDGFVWIERKHYFKPELNPRFFLRQRAPNAN
jgi:hypothetical protein